MAMTTIASGAGRLRRGAPQQSGEQRAALTPLEARLLTLRPGATAWDAPPPAATALARTPAAATPAATRPKRLLRRAAWCAHAAFWIALLVAASFASYVIDTGGKRTPFPSAPAQTGFTGSASGSGRVVVPVVPGDLSLRVAVDPAVAAPGGWFWCFDSDRGLPPDQHYCASAGARDPATGYIVADGVVRLDAATVQGATFFVQMYCQDTCRWQAEVAPAPSAGAVASEVNSR